MPEASWTVNLPSAASSADLQHYVWNSIETSAGTDLSSSAVSKKGIYHGVWGSIETSAGTDLSSSAVSKKGIYHVVYGRIEGCTGTDSSSSHDSKIKDQKERRIPSHVEFLNSSDTTSSEQQTLSSAPASPSKETASREALTIHALQAKKVRPPPETASTEAHASSGDQSLSPEQGEKDFVQEEYKREHAALKQSALADKREKHIVREEYVKELGKLESEAPADKLGGLPSIGSIAHFDVQCRPCSFNYTNVGCNRGIHCLFCHLSHRDQYTMRPSKSRRDRHRKLIQQQEREMFGDEPSKTKMSL